MMTFNIPILKEVIVHGQVSAIKINGHTSEFTANNFAVRGGASVEEMLKKLPGYTGR